MYERRLVSVFPCLTAQCFRWGFLVRAIIWQSVGGAVKPEATTVAAYLNANPLIMSIHYPGNPKLP
jgi:hypothetical protein